MEKCKSVFLACDHFYKERIYLDREAFKKEGEGGEEIKNRIFETNIRIIES